MNFLYNILVILVGVLLKVLALFNTKMKLFVEGRKQTYKKITSVIAPTDKVIWFHCASLGEFEQGRPIIEKIKQTYPTHKLVLTFFSPSGFEIRKNYNQVDVVCYLPLDSKHNAKKFLNSVNPILAIFVKYEFWPIILSELQQRNIKTILVSGIFRKNQSFFKWYGTWMRKALSAFDHFFVQDQNSKELLNKINFLNTTVSGDSRFDRVFEITKQNNTLPFIEEFINNNYTLVAGSTWKDDEELLVNYINKNALENQKIIIAPHNINNEAIQKLKKAIHKNTVLYSQKEGKKLKDYHVFILDTIGILTKIYSYANIAYVGGGFTKSGVHNILEPATFGIPIVIGPNYDKFKEVKDLVKVEACFSIDNSKKLSVLLEKFFQFNSFRENAGNIALNYVINKTGATTKILDYLKK
jgi:3-deoxy-D-manno-octulosonic-acid transferase